MTAPLSIIIPTLNAAATIGPTLESLWEGMEAGIVAELIIVDGGSNDDIAEIADGIGAQFLTTSAGRGGQMAAGSEMAKGKWLLFVHADTRLSEGWADAIRRHIQSSPKAGYGKLQFQQNGFAPRFVAGWANLRSRLFSLPYGDQTLLISQQMLHGIGGMPNLPLMEDVAIARKLRSNLRALPFVAITDGAKFARQGWFRRGARNLCTLALYFFGWSPERLAKRYRS